MGKFNLSKILKKQDNEDNKEYQEKVIPAFIKLQEELGWRAVPEIRISSNGIAPVILWRKFTPQEREMIRNKNAKVSKVPATDEKVAGN